MARLHLSTQALSLISGTAFVLTCNEVLWVEVRWSIRDTKDWQSVESVYIK